MDNVKKLLDAVKAKCDRHTDYAVAQKLELHSGLISDYYHGKRVPDDFACLQIAKELGKPFPEVLATVKADTEKNEKRRKAWENYLKGMGEIAASFALPFLMVVTLIMTPTSAQALPAMNLEYPTLCIMLNKIKTAIALDKRRMK